MKVYSVTEISKETGLSKGRLRELIHLGFLKAHKVGREWAITETDFEMFKQLDRRVGQSPIKPDDPLMGVNYTLNESHVKHIQQRAIENAIEPSDYIRRLIEADMKLKK